MERDKKILGRPPGPVSRYSFFSSFSFLFFYFLRVQVQIYNIDLWNRLIARLWSAIYSSVRRYARIPPSLSCPVLAYGVPGKRFLNLNLYIIRARARRPLRFLRSSSAIFISDFAKGDRANSIHRRKFCWLYITQDENDVNFELYVLRQL